MSVSGAGVLASSDNKDEAQKFVEFLTSEEGQQALADSYALEYPLNPAVEPRARRSSRSPSSSRRRSRVSDLDADTVVDLMTEAGFL